VGAAASVHNRFYHTLLHFTGVNMTTGRYLALGLKRANKRDPQISSSYFHQQSREGIITQSTV